MLVTVEFLTIAGQLKTFCQTSLLKLYELAECFKKMERCVLFAWPKYRNIYIVKKIYIFLCLLFSSTVLLEMDRIQLWAGPTCIIHKQASCCFTFSKRQKMACQIKNVKLNLIVFIRLVLLKRNTQGRSCVGSVSRCLKRNILYRWVDFSRQCLKWIPHQENFSHVICWYQTLQICPDKLLILLCNWIRW